METWERIASGVKKELAKTHRVDLDYEKKCARFYRTTYFTHGPVPYAPYEGKEEILIDGNENTAIVNKLGFGFYKLEDAVIKTLNRLRIGAEVKEFSNNTEGIKYSWKGD